jgi:hypothetical protein
MRPAVASVDILSAELPAARTKTNSLEGSPLESELVLFADEHTEFGIWEVTPGRFASQKTGVCELMHFVQGSGTITGLDGTVTDIAPGVVVFLPDGWEGTWHVTNTVRKSYAVYST